MAESFEARLKPAALGLTLAVLTILYGQFLGVLFGLKEDSIKSQLQHSAVQVRETIYNGDEAAMKKVQNKSWTYMKRAHLHAGGMGTTALSFIILLAFLGPPKSMTKGLSAALGVGGLGYSVFWMWAGLRAPGLGSTGAAKESLRWLAMPSSGAFVLASVAVFALVLKYMVQRSGE